MSLSCFSTSEGSTINELEMSKIAPIHQHENLKMSELFVLDGVTGKKEGYNRVIFNIGKAENQMTATTPTSDGCSPITPQKPPELKSDFLAFFKKENPSLMQIIKLKRPAKAMTTKSPNPDDLKSFNDYIKNLITLLVQKVGKVFITGNVVEIFMKSVKFDTTNEQEYGYDSLILSVHSQAQCTKAGMQEPKIELNLGEYLSKRQPTTEKSDIELLVKGTSVQKALKKNKNNVCMPQKATELSQEEGAATNQGDPTATNQGDPPALDNPLVAGAGGENEVPAEEGEFGGGRRRVRNSLKGGRRRVRRSVKGGRRRVRRSVKGGRRRVRNASSRKRQ